MPGAAYREFNFGLGEVIDTVRDQVRRFAEEREVKGLPLLEALHAIVWRDAPPAETLRALRLSVGR